MPVSRHADFGASSTPRAPARTHTRTEARIDIRGLAHEVPGGRVLFTDLNAALPGGVTALVGPNGVGKTTLARLIAGELEPQRGRIHRRGPVVLFAQREEPPRCTVRQYLEAGLGQDEEPWGLVADARLFGIFVDSLCRAPGGTYDDTRVATLSGGQWTRLRLARLLIRLAPEDALILDEPTNDLDREGRDAVLALLRHRRHAPGTTLLIAHDREALALAENTLELSRHGLSLTGGGWDAYVRARDQEQERLAQALARAEKERDKARKERDTERERQDKRNRRGAEDAARGGQARILLGLRKRAAQATTGKTEARTAAQADAAVRGLREAVEALKIDPVLYAALEGAPLPARKLVAEATGFNIRYEGSEDRNARSVLARPIDFAWRGNVRIALRGGNGRGKSTVLKALAGLLPSTAQVAGALRLGGCCTVVLDQRGAGLDDRLNVFEHMRAVSTDTDTAIRNRLAGFLFAGDSAFQPVGTLSGGERLRAALARAFLASPPKAGPNGTPPPTNTLPELLLLDEPTNNLDLGNIAFLEKVVAGFRGAVIVVSHDETFLANCRLEKTMEI